jgi:hypothetical protein
MAHLLVPIEEKTPLYDSQEQCGYFIEKEGQISEENEKKA